MTFCCSICLFFKRRALPPFLVLRTIPRGLERCFPNIYLFHVAFSLRPQGSVRGRGDEGHSSQVSVLDLCVPCGSIKELSVWILPTEHRDSVCRHRDNKVQAEYRADLQALVSPHSPLR